MLSDDKRSWQEWQVPPAMAAEARKLGWINEACDEGLSWIRAQRGYRDFRRALDTISATDQSPSGTSAYRSRLNTNRLKRNIREVVSVMSKLRPFWGYHSDNRNYNEQAEMMNKVTRAWYLEAFADRAVKEALQYAAATGRGWIRPVYRRDMYGMGHGDIRLLTYGAPAVLPVQLPNSGNWQEAYAVTFLDETPVAMAHGMFPAFQDRLRPTGSRYWYMSDAVRKATLGNIVQRMFGKTPRNVENTALSDLLVPIRYTYVLDLSINTTDKPIPMGEPGASWAYTVPFLGQEIPAGSDTQGRTIFRKATEADARLYPYRRLLISSDACCMYDGPGFDWHGMLPGVSFCPDHWPWEPLGFSLVHDGYEINESIKEIYRGNMDKIRADLDPGLVFDKNATSMKEMRAFDPMQPRARLGVDGSTVDPAGWVRPAVDPEILKVKPESMAMIEKLESAMDSQMAINDFAALAKARAVGSMDELEKIVEASGPIIEDMSRSMEPPMRDLGNMIKYLVLQYYTVPRIMQIVGPDGITPMVFDYDPTKLTPSHLVGEDPSRPSAFNAVQRARNFADNLRFYIMPNSLHEITQMVMKLGYIQLKKAGVKISSQKIAESWQVDNYGTFDGNTEIEKWQSEQEMDILFMARMKELVTALGLTPPAGPSGGGKQEGRPPSGNAPPSLKSKDNGARSTITESK